MTRLRIKFCLISALGLSLSACVSMPDFGDNPPPAEIAEEIRKSRSFPDVRDAPTLPDDLKKTNEWEGAVNTLSQQGNVFDRVNADAPFASPNDILSRIANMKSYVDAHYIDDAKSTQ